MADDDLAAPVARVAGGDTDIRTFLIADVRGYTLFTQERGDEAAGKLAAKFAELAREAVEARGGTLLELRGDEALCVFGSPRQAIRTAVDMQERFVEETMASPELPLTVGIGLDAGEAVAVEGGYRGGALNLAARLCGQARAGEILASREVAHLARRVEGVRYEERGTLSLKGLAEPVHVVRVVPEQLDAVARLSSFAAAPPPPPRPVWRRSGVVIPVLVAIALVAVSVPLLRSGDGAIDIGTNSVGRVSASDGSLAFATELGERPGASAVGFGSLWVAQPDRGVVARLSLEDGSIVDPSIRVGASPDGVAVGDGSVWVTNAGAGTVSRIDAETNEVSQEIEAGSRPTGIAFGDGSLWVIDAFAGELLKIDPRSGAAESLRLTGDPAGVAFTSEGVWVSIAPDGVARVDPSDLGVTFPHQSVGNGPTAVLAAFGSIWVANHLDDSVSRLEPATGREVAKIPVRDGPNALAAAAGSVWVGNELDGSITEIDPDTNEVEPPVPVGGTVGSLTTSGDDLWLAVGASATEHLGGTLTVSSEDEAPGTLDPAFAFSDSLEGQILSITNDGLLSFKKVGGSDGATLVPDLASALPEVLDDGMTYRFPVRQGIVYSTGEPVRPEDFRRALERSLLNPEIGFLFGAIEGADACMEARDECDLSESIEVSEEAVTIHLATADPDLPFKLASPQAFPVPADTPLEDQGLDALPATGPYMVETAGPAGIELVRNPEFVEWSRAAQPDGFADAISFRFNEDPATAFERLDAGQLDWMRSRPRAEDLAVLQTSSPDQLVLWPRPVAYYAGFDIREPPFDDVRVRRALNYAIDRGRVVELAGGATSQHLTCQLLPPNIQGYEPFCPYTLEPGNDVWSAPDRDRARALIEEAGAVGDEVTVWVTDDPGFNPELADAVGIMEHVVDVLNDIGLDARLEIVHDPDKYLGTIYFPGPDSERYQVYAGGWSPTYPGAGGFIDEFFRCGIPSQGPITCSERLDAAIEEARRIHATDPPAAHAAWVEIEHGLVEEAVWVPMTNPATPYAFSDRVENVQVHPELGILVSQLWVR
jgi:peptide/nickel transport system substrate-binding protein